jgi:hypothetical protein
MQRVKTIRQNHNHELENHCQKNNIQFSSVQKLLEAEKTKKLFKRNALMQQNIDKEIDNSFEHENR